MDSERSEEDEGEMETNDLSSNLARYYGSRGVSLVKDDGGSNNEGKIETKLHSEPSGQNEDKNITTQSEGPTQIDFNEVKILVDS